MFLTQMLKKLFAEVAASVYGIGQAGWVGTIGWLEWKGQRKNDWKGR